MNEIIVCTYTKYIGRFKIEKEAQILKGAGALITLARRANEVEKCMNERFFKERLGIQI